MAAKLTLILGGARSGKSSFAEARAAEAEGTVIYVATAQAFDEEMEERIRAHRASRPANWVTVEAPVAVAQALGNKAVEAEVVLLDCVTLMAMNAYGMGVEDDLEAQAAAEATLMKEVEQLLEVAADSEAVWLVVSNEVGLGLVPPSPLGRAYRDALGRANQRLAKATDEVIFMVAGLPTWVKGPTDSS